jgi:hypothetical protein
MKLVRLPALCTGCLYPPRKYTFLLISVRGLVNPRAILWPEGLCPWKIPVISSGIEPATFQLTVQCCKQLHLCVPQPYKNMGFTHLQIEPNPWLADYRPQIPILSALCPWPNPLNPPPKQNFWVHHCHSRIPISYAAWVKQTNTMHWLH